MGLLPHEWSYNLWISLIMLNNVLKSLIKEWVTININIIIAYKLSK